MGGVEWERAHGALGASGSAVLHSGPRAPAPLLPRRKSRLLHSHPSMSLPHRLSRTTPADWAGHSQNVVLSFFN